MHDEFWMRGRATMVTMRLKRAEGWAGSSMRVRWPAMGAAQVARRSSVHRGARAVVMGSSSHSTVLRGRGGSQCRRWPSEEGVPTMGH